MASVSVGITSAAYENDETDNEFWCADPGVLHGMLSGSNIMPISQEIEQNVNDVEYEIYGLGSKNPEVEISFTLDSDGISVPVSSNGELKITELTEELTLAEAHLYDIKDINGNNIKFNMSFSKILERDGASITATITSDGTSGIALISMGEDVLTADVMEHVSWFNSENEFSREAEEKEEYTSRAASGYKTIEKPFDNGERQKAQRMYFKCDDSSGAVTVAVQSFRKNAADVVLNAQTIFPYAQAAVDSVSIELKRVDGDGYVDGIEELQVDETNHINNDDYALYKLLIENVLAEIEIDTGFVEPLWEAMIGTDIEVKKYTNRYLVTWDAGYGSSLPDLDNAPFPVIFQLTSNNLKETEFSASTDLSYKVYLYNRGQDGRYFYVNAETAVNSFSWAKEV